MACFPLPFLLVVFRPRISLTTAEYPTTRSNPVIRAGWVGRVHVEDFMF